MKDSLKPATIAAHAAGARSGAGVVPGVAMATTFRRRADYQPEAPGYTYGRDHNETVAQAEAVLCQLEGAVEARLFPSGMAGVAALMRAVPSGGRIVLQSGIYWGVTAWVRAFCSRRGVRLTECDTSRIGALEAACATSADLVWVETPSNPWLKITDISAAANTAHRAGAILAVDSTAATPVLSQPLSLGADVVMHSGTKAINGHSDVLAGVLAVRDSELPAWVALKADRQEAGAILGPMEAWLLLRGMRTLPLRVDRMCRSAQTLAEALSSHPRVVEVWYPGLPDHPGHDLAARQMQGGYGMLISVLIEGGAAQALGVAGRLALFQSATSLGGVESLVEHRATIEPQSGIPETLLRLSVGIEDVDDLLADLKQALAGLA